MTTALTPGWPALATAAMIIFLAGLSEGLGTQGVVLLINRISPLRFALNMLLSALLYLLSALLWVGILWLVAAVIFRDDGSLRLAFVAVSASYLPLLLSALALLPSIGPLLGRLLRLWSLLAGLAAIGAAFSLPLWQAALCATLGWLLRELLRLLLSAPARRLSRRLWQITTGHAAQLGPGDLPLAIAGYEPGGAEP